MSEGQRWVIDSIEESVAAVELSDGQVIHLPVKLLPKGAKQGQVLRVTLEIDAAATKQALTESAAQVKKGRDASRKRDPGGDIAL
jgi:hypothetical protein